MLINFYANLVDLIELFYYFHKFFLEESRAHRLSNMFLRSIRQRMVRYILAFLKRLDFILQGIEIILWNSIIISFTILWTFHFRRYQILELSVFFNFVRASCLSSSPSFSPFFRLCQLIVTSSKENCTNFFNSIFRFLLVTSSQMVCMAYQWMNYNTICNLMHQVSNNRCTMHFYLTQPLCR